MSVSEATTNWDAFNQPFPSLNEYEAKGGGTPIETDTVEDGEYTLQLQHMSAPMEDQFADPNDKNPKPIVFLYFRVTGADDPGDVGKVIRKKLKYTGHPKGAAYPFLKAAYGGNIPPDQQPSFSAMRDMSIKVYLQTRTDMVRGKPITFQAWEAIRPVKSQAPF